MFEIEGRIYELRYDMKTVEQLENATGISIVDMIQSVPTLTRLKMMIGMALWNEHGNKVSSKTGSEMAEKFIQERGLLECFRECVNKISEDCAFLFRNA